MAVIKDKKKIEEILNRGVDKVIVKEHLKKRLLSGQKIKLYYGIDPTSPFLHLGHSVVLRKLKQFQELGHQVILLIGDFTARIGDPTDKEATRKPLTEQEIKENMKTYQKQAAKILDFNSVSLQYNSAWLAKLKSEDWLGLASKISVQQLLAREMFQKRIKNDKPISLQEFLYPLMQGYDSVAMNVDLEIAGADQLFNMLVGRDLQKIYNQKDKDVLTTKLLIGTDGRKMSKTFKNTIALTDPADEMFGKIMSMKDELIGDYFELCTNLSSIETARLKKEIKNPKDLKSLLAKEIVKLYHGEKEAQRAEKEFNKIFRDKGLPANLPVFKTSQKVYPALELFKESGLVNSKQEAKRIILGGGAAIIINKQEEIIKDWQRKINLTNNMVLRAGKRKFIKIDTTP